MLDALVASDSLRRRVTPSYWLTSAESPLQRTYQRTALPHGLARVVHRVAGEPGWLRRTVVRRFLADLREGDVAWLFPSVDAAAYRAVRDRGGAAVMEVVNTALPSHRDALLRAHAAIGWPPTGIPGEAEIADESERVRLADYLFTCSPWTSRSLTAIGAQPGQLLPSSYGWDPASFRPEPQRSDRPRFLFVANGIVRKGLPHLLRAWERAAPRATLVLVGDLAPEIAERCQAQLRRPDVEHHQHTGDLAGLYGRADVFVLPSFEEGSPLVTYLALAAGLPCLLSPEAAGWVVREGQEGLLAPPDDEAAWVELLRRVAEDRPLREQLGARALLRSHDFTWDRVIERRCAVLLQRLDERAGRTPPSGLPQTPPTGP